MRGLLIAVLLLLVANSPIYAADDPQVRPGGCPEGRPCPPTDTKPKPKPKPKSSMAWFPKVEFEAYKADPNSIRPDSKVKLDAFAEALTDAKMINTVSIIGPVFTAGKAQDSSLAMARANTIKEYLEAKGVSEEKIRVNTNEAIKTNPNCKTLAGWALVGCMALDDKVKVIPDEKQ